MWWEAHAITIWDLYRYFHSETINFIRCSDFGQSAACDVRRITNALLLFPISSHKSQLREIV